MAQVVWSKTGEIFKTNDNQQLGEMELYQAQDAVLKAWELFSVHESTLDMHERVMFKLGIKRLNQFLNHERMKRGLI